ncbi:TraY domain-containing protein [Photobacterium indicum]|uniref:TraY domain-containing protein n=1 Tax=Photobacterium indicum TaxID=81447 RepID=UPI003D14C886
MTIRFMQQIVTLDPESKELLIKAANSSNRSQRAEAHLRLMDHLVKYTSINGIYLHGKAGNTNVELSLNYCSMLADNQQSKRRADDAGRRIKDHLLRFEYIAAIGRTFER